MDGGGSENEGTRSDERGPSTRAIDKEKEVWRSEQEARGMGDR